MGVKPGAKTSPYIESMMKGAARIGEPLTEMQIELNAKWKLLDPEGFARAVAVGKANEEHYLTMLRYLGWPDRQL